MEYFFIYLGRNIKNLSTDKKKFFADKKNKRIFLNI